MDSNLFKLDWQEYLVMSSYQYYLTLQDVEREENINIRRLKKTWAKNWKNYIEEFLASLANKKVNSLDEEHLFDYSNELLKHQSRLIDRITILIELIVFNPYFIFEKDDCNNKEYENLKADRGNFFTDDCWIEEIKYISEYLCLDPVSCLRLKDFFEEAIKGIKGGGNLFWWLLVGAALFALLAPFAIPAVVGLLAPAGLYGAAATSSVLAALGGGAIAVGGFGMAGGVAVIIGGGALIGGVTGGVLGTLLKDAPDLVVLQGAKLVATVREVHVHNRKLAYELGKAINSGLRKSIHQLEEKIESEYLSGDLNDARRKEKENLEKSIEYLRKTIKVIQDFLAENSNLYGSSSFGASILLEYTGTYRQIYSAPPQLPAGKNLDVEQYRFSPVCSNCLHLSESDSNNPYRACTAFPERIPDEIWFGRNLHQSHYPGDHGIQFTKL
ncbi:hypothetical protein RIF25_10565 [Thermosynechococcaceae cyanobacterium BACA0444]|uniref:Uncharacterized protein n=1 Tax=Pseudocalidococcus azoricus BACA0444 TaxID=2918990 RepID=A0AAE4FTU6_9CYAN|nr:hypothetical protein [Pseudocalidococcus azoricus]MDS3861249.1 hypothetical protein [Pseudocalidococcus azoricus BACA0444]